MNLVVVVLLAVLWASILLPGILRGRRRSPTSSIDAFERSMGILANDLLHARVPGTNGGLNPGRRVLVVADPARLARQPARLRTLRRRRQVLQALVVCTVLSALAAVVAGGWTVALVAVAGTALAGYIALLTRIRAREADARRTLRRLPEPAAASAPHAGEPRPSRRIAAGDSVADSPV